jgi:hypothetical protein
MFINPWAIAIGALAAGLPLAVHFLTRPRPVPMPLSTLRFVHEVVQERRARHRLRDAIVLTLRTLAVLLVAFAVARPFLGKSEATAVDERAQSARVVIVDVSQSMAATGHGVRAFERARATAARQLEYKSGMKAGLILAGARASSVFTRASSNFSAMREELSHAEPVPERLAVQEALNLASEILARDEESPDVRREVVVVSDFQRSNWAAADFAVLPAGTHIELESVAAPAPPPNLAILRVGAQDRAEVGRDLRLEVEVGNFSDSPQTLSVDVQLGEATLQVSGLCGPYAKAVFTGDVVLRDAGWQTGVARLMAANDALPEDNQRAFVVEVRTPPRLALLTREPATKRPSASYFIERAVAPDQNSAGGAEASDDSQPGTGRLVRLDPARLDREVLGTADLVVIVRPGRMTPETINPLVNHNRRGRGILYVASEADDAANLRLIAEAATGILKLPVEFAPPSPRNPRKNLFLAEVQKEQSPFQVFGDELPLLLGSLRFSGGLDSRRMEGALAEDVLGQYGDQSAFLVNAAAQSGGGFLVMNADLAASNLPLSPFFVPFLEELVQRLLGQGRNAEGIACGEPFALTLPAEASGAAELTIAGPEPGGPAMGSLADEGASVLWKGEAAGRPGVYRVIERDQPVFAVGTAIPAVESDLRPLAAEVFQDRLTGGRDVHYRSAAPSGREERDTFWNWLAITCVACLLSEIAALKLFRT